MAKAYCLEGRNQVGYGSKRSNREPLPPPAKVRAQQPGGLMSNNAVKVKTLRAHAVLAELQEQGLYERNLARFEADDDVPTTPNPLDSAQARRAAK